MNATRFASLDQWLRWQDGLHPFRIDMGLERVCTVASALGLERLAFPVLSIAGTNGKGSCVAFAEAMACAAGYRVAAYTSPHLLRYNERIRVDGRELDDAEIMTAFERVDRARRGTSLTSFEFGTLAAVDLFVRSDVDFAVLEVGLGGRLDAVNLVDADAALLSSVGIDHREWLGETREEIGLEKAGIFRGRRPAVCAERVPPQSVLRHAAALSARLAYPGRGYDFADRGETWDWLGAGGTELRGLPRPALTGAHQIGNAAAVIAALGALAPRLAVSRPAIERGLADASLPGRIEVLPGPVERILDVAHNPQAGAALAATLAGRPCRGRTVAVAGFLRDKDIEGLVAALAPEVSRWEFGAVPGARGADAAELRRRIEACTSRDLRFALHARVPDAYRAARSGAQDGDRIVIFGCFHAVSSVARLAREETGAEVF